MITTMTTAGRISGRVMWMKVRQALAHVRQPPARAGGEPGADEQLVAVSGEHLREHLQVLFERRGLCAYALHLLDEQQTACFERFGPAGDRPLWLWQVRREEPGVDQIRPFADARDP
jgi:hypothetical protein